MLSVLGRLVKALFIEEEANCDNKWNDVPRFKECRSGADNAVDNASPLHFIRKKGRITYMSDEYGLIDETLYFTHEILPKTCSVSLGDQVYYTAFKANENEAERVEKIEPMENLQEFEDEDLGTSAGNDAIELDKLEDKPFQNKDFVVRSCERVLNGIVRRRNGKELFIHPLNISFNLDAIKFDVIPIEGDHVSLVAEVSIDPDAENLAGDILHIKHLKPLLVRNGRGAITFLNTNSNQNKGVIENEIYFSNEFCRIDFEPKLGDRVAYSALESEQGRHKWRALTVELLGVTQRRMKSSTGTDSTVEKKEFNIVITGKSDFGPLEIDTSEELTLEVKNVGKTSETLLRCSFRTPKAQSQVTLKSHRFTDSIVIEPNSSVKFVFECKGRFLGASTEIFIFHFKNSKVVRRFNIDVTVGSELQELMQCDSHAEGAVAANETYLWRNFDYSDALYGMKPIISSRFNHKRSMKKYNIPETLFKIVLGEMEDPKERRKMTAIDFAPCLTQNLDYNNYFEKFHTLMYLEEIRNRLSYRKHDLHGVTFHKKNHYLALDVSSAIDGGVKFVVGTSVTVTQPWSEANTGKQVGYIHEFREGSEIFVKFHDSFHASYDESDCDVTFQPGRSTYVRCHMAVDAVARLGEFWLFPTRLVEKEPLLCLRPQLDDLSLEDFSCDIDENGYAIPKKGENINIQEIKDGAGGVVTEGKKLTWFNRGLNDLQKAAVIKVLEGRCRPLPYIIYGPPGTGKTVTVVEIVLQVYHMFSDSRILIGTPSNSPANIICSLLIESGKFTPGELVRLLSVTRATSGEVPENIIPFCVAVYDTPVISSKTVTLQNIREGRTLEAIGTQRIVIGTCSTLGSLHIANLPEGHFSHIIIDEAAQATEPLTLIPITFLDPKRGQVVLSGDTEQLGSVCLEPLCTKYGYTKSLMERLMNTPPYLRDKTKFPATNGYNPSCITKLLVNYRCVPEILNLPSKLFYDSELIPTLSQTEGFEADLIRKFNFEVEARDTPPALIFHGIRGQNYREANGYSWYNPYEIWQVVRYLKRLYSIDLTPEFIGIITPYVQQVKKLRQLLNALAIPIPKIGSVDEFQGQERYVIILSTVRSFIRPEDTAEDPLGFVASPRRLNVAITRARAILIIVGNPFILSLDPYWASVIQYCMNNGSYVGCSFSCCRTKPA